MQAWHRGLLEDAARNVGTTPSQLQGQISAPPPTQFWRKSSTADSAQAAMDDVAEEHWRTAEQDKQARGHAVPGGPPSQRGSQELPTELSLNDALQVRAVAGRAAASEPANAADTSQMQQLRLNVAHARHVSNTSAPTPTFGPPSSGGGGGGAAASSGSNEGPSKARGARQSHLRHALTDGLHRVAHPLSARSSSHNGSQNLGDQPQEAPTANVLRPQSSSSLRSIDGHQDGAASPGGARQLRKCMCAELIAVIGRRARAPWGTRCVAVRLLFICACGCAQRHATQPVLGCC